jgi:hypothetical protein
MGRIARHESPARALAEVYGCDLKALDAGFAAWVRGR